MRPYGVVQQLFGDEQQDAGTPYDRPLGAERGAIRDLFLRLLGAVFLAAFLSLLAQVKVLFGAQGLLPAADYLRAVFLMPWLVFRLHVESGLAKILLGDPTWRDLTALAIYYETAPLPTWVGWWAHQLPMGVHRLASASMYLVELGLPFLLLGPR